MMIDQEFYLRAAPARLIDVINDFLFFFKAVRCWYFKDNLKVVFDNLGYS